MAATPAARRLTEAHRLAQARLGAQTVAAMRSAWGLLDPFDLDATADRWLRTTVPLVTAQRSTSARLAGAYVQAFRAFELATDPLDFVPVLADQVAVEQIVQSLTVTGPVQVKRHMRGLRPAAGDLEVVTARAMQIGRDMAAGAAMRHVLNAGRGTVVDSVRADGAALGWARATSGKPCGFCAMLASRGPVYDADSVGFDAHDHCSCSAEPVYRDGSPWPAGAEDFRTLWDETTVGLSGDAARNAFRAVIEAAR